MGATDISTFATKKFLDENGLKKLLEITKEYIDKAISGINPSGSSIKGEILEEGGYVILNITSSSAI